MSERIALFIGVSEYSDKTLAKLMAPGADASALANVLLDETIGNFKKEKKEDNQVLINRPVEEIRRQITRLYRRRDPNDLILLYYSGHGILEDGQLYLAATNTERDLIEATAIPAREITYLMDRGRSRRQILILDCCHSGAFDRSGSFKTANRSTGKSVGTKEAFEGNGFGRIVLTASDATQYAWDGDEVIGEGVNSVFTHYLIEGLKTGEADINNDGKVDVDELYDYIYQNVRKEQKKQTPEKWTYKLKGDLYIARNPYRKIVHEPIPPEPGAQSYQYQAARYGIGYELLRVKCMINEDGSATIARKVTVKAFSETRKLDTYLLISGDESRDVNIDLVRSLTPGWTIELTDTIEELGRLSAELTISPPLEEEQMITYEMREELAAVTFAIQLTEDEISNRKIPYDFFNWNINRPTNKLVLETHFPPHTDPTVFSAEVRYASASGFPSVRLQEQEQKWYEPYWVDSLEDNRRILKLEVDYPMLGLIYGLRWQPVPLD